MVKELTIETVQVDPAPKSHTNCIRTLTRVLMIYGLYMERKLRVMMKPK